MSIKVNTEKCTGCGACMHACPVDAITIKERKAVIGEDCICCGACVPECPVNALTM